MSLRAAKTALVFAIALYYCLVVFNNITDYGSNDQLVRHNSHDGFHVFR